MLQSITEINVISFLFSFATIYATYIYILKIPHLITNKQSLVDEYYKKQPTKHLSIDFVLVTVYISIANYIYNALYYKKNITKQLIILSLVTLTLTTLFYVFFTQIQVDSSIYSRWFRQVGWIRSVVFDSIIVNTILVLYVTLQNSF